MKQIAWDEVMKRLEVASKICNDASPVQVEGPIHVGVDLGTADVVVMAVDDNGMPVSAFLEWATVVRDGVVVDYHGAITIVKRLVSMTEERLGRKITEASTSYPPGTDARLSTNILDAANLRLVSTADEPSCLARLARLDRAAVVDIGGQDCKAILLDNGLNVVDFIMNDKCAAGTGRFIEVMMRILEEDINNIDRFVEGHQPINITSMCTVFAESEIISLLAKGADKGDIALGIINSICRRTSFFAQKLNLSGDIFFSGGLAQFEIFRSTLEGYLKIPVHTSPLSQFAGAIGAAVIGYNKVKRQQA